MNSSQSLPSLAARLGASEMDPFLFRCVYVRALHQGESIHRTNRSIHSDGRLLGRDGLHRYPLWMGNALPCCYGFCRIHRPIHPAVTPSGTVYLVSSKPER